MKWDFCILELKTSVEKQDMNMLNLRGDAEASVIEGWMTQCYGSLEERKSVVG